MVIGNSADPDQTTECGIWLGSLLFPNSLVIFLHEYLILPPLPIWDKLFAYVQYFWALG